MDTLTLMDTFCTATRRSRKVVASELGYKLNYIYKVFSGNEPMNEDFRARWVKKYGEPREELKKMLEVTDD